jgi:hypothetical protein
MINSENMSIINFSCLFLFSSLLIGCHNDTEEFPAIRRWVNETEFELKIKVTGSDVIDPANTNFFLDEIIQPKDSIEFSTFCFISHGGSCDEEIIPFSSPGLIIFQDSLWIVYSKELILNPDSLGVMDRFPLVPIPTGKPYEITKEGDTRIYTYRFDSVDLARAVPIPEGQVY